ncbi:MAG: ribonuclease Z [Candidatus Zixiibacteriota bacterium]|nr:MAG: ribonuclease Z [candidate division Zixibacteria bacterium]
MKATWTILGSASGGASPERACSGHVLAIDGRLLIFDCGSGTASSFQRSGFDPHGVEAFIISHTHPDHISDLPMFLQMFFLADCEQDLNIFLPAEAVRPIKNYLNTCYLFPEKLPFRRELYPIRYDMEFVDGKVTVTPIGNQHLVGNVEIIEASAYPNRMECYSFLVRAMDKKVVYSSDLSSIHDVEKHLDDLDLLVTEAMHIDINELPDVLSARKVSRTVLTHTDDERLPELTRFADAVPAEIDLAIAEDNLTIEL